jgi:heat shock protein HslJ
MISVFQTMSAGWLALCFLTVVPSVTAHTETTAPDHADPSTSMHALVGEWWLKTVFDEDGAPLWSGGGQNEPITMTVDATGDIHTLAACNSYFGRFGTAVGTAVALDPPLMMTTRIMCWGEYPPVVRFERIARFDRGPVELRFFDGEDRLIAAYIDMKAMQDELDFARGRECGE